MLSHQVYDPLLVKPTPYRACGWGSVDWCCGGDVMRRPTFCHNSVAAVEVAAQRQGAPHHTGAGPNAQGANQDKEETRLARMKRILTGSLLMGGGRRPPAGPPLKTFAVHLDDLPLTNEGLPRAVVRITNFIEKYGLQMEGLFRLSGGNPKLVEQLKASFDRTGDADLEGSGDVTSVAALLKLWIRDLPEPVVPAAGASELVALLQKYKGDTEDWCREVGRLLACDNASALLRERNARLLRCVLRLLHRYQLQQSAAHQQLHQSTAAAAAQQLAPVFAALLLSVDDGMPRIASPDTTALMFALIVNYARVYDESLSCNDVKMDGASTPETRLYSAGKNKSLNAPSLNNMSETTPLAYSGSKKQRKRKDRQSSADRMFVRSNSEERPCKSSCGGGLSVVSGGGSGGGGGAGGGFRRVSSHEDFSRSRANHAQKGAQLMELISETATSIQMSTPVTSSRGPLHERNQQFALRSSNSTTTTAKNNNLNKTTTTPSADYNQKLEYPNNNNNEALPWQPGDAVRRDDSLAVSVVCSPPADCQLMSGGTADEEEEREHERRRSSERFAPCGGGVMMMGGGRRRGGGGDSGERRRRKVARGGSSTPSRRRHRDARSPRRVCCSSSSEGGVGGGDSSSKENEEEEGQQQMSPRRHSTLMVVSPPPPISCHRGVPPPPTTAASLSGEEDEREGEGGGSDGGLGEAGSMSRSSSTESEEGELGEPQHDPDEQQDEKEEGQERKEAVEEEVKGDVEELEEVEDDDEEVDEEGEGEEEDLNNDEPVLDLNRLHRNMDLSEPVPSRHDWSFAPQLPQPQQERLDDAESLRSSATFAAGHRAFEAAQAVSAAAAATPADQLPLSGRTHIAVIEHHHAKQIHTLKKRLKRYEEGFEREFGYKPSSADKMANPDTKKMCQTLSKLRRELKQLKSESTLCASASMSQLLFLASGDHRVSVAGTPTKVINEEVVHDVEKRLNDKRSTARRPTVLEEMSREQLGDEKTAVQRALLQLESVYGRPATRDQRDLVRPLYDRYRQLKRLLARATANAKLKEGVAELGTILEHEQMDFSSSSPPPPSAPIAAPLVPPPAPAPTQRPTTPDYFDNLHALPRNELLDQHKTTREEKKRLRRQLHEFEDEMESKMGRKLQREDRQPMDAVYTQYKHIKAKLRLIEALITKK